MSSPEPLFSPLKFMWDILVFAMTYISHRNVPNLMMI